MKIRSNSLMAAALAGIVACVIGFAPVSATFAADKPMNSKAAGPALKAAKASLDAKKYPDAINKLKDAQGISGKNPYDEHLINEMLSFAYVRTNQYAEAAKVMEADLDSQYNSEPERQKRIRQLIQIHYNLKNYDKVLALGDRAIKGNFADDETYTWMSQAYFLKGDFKSASKFIDGQVVAQIKA